MNKILALPVTCALDDYKILTVGPLGDDNDIQININTSSTICIKNPDVARLLAAKLNQMAQALEDSLLSEDVV